MFHEQRLKCKIRGPQRNNRGDARPVLEGDISAVNNMASVHRAFPAYRACRPRGPSRNISRGMPVPFASSVCMSYMLAQSFAAGRAAP